ncbi:50S ribosomal protein L10 [Actinotignum urinale]|uniref:Large ribosomal subunit protein uL10 n=1 Tax=Actinotignum urinale TaxID=190146 RepID=A0ABU5GAW3_9ACTO|nr:50S ribosomal protein L10 [Actinotignum urinale]MDY5129834.1 50S ribosomal protein L10 [Actinotignum urinale]MDY5132773.1 50S ribosomal protein L10 [Actinotignum urinale]
MARTDKSAAIAELKELFENSTAALFTEYRGLTVGEMKDLRRSFQGGAVYKVAKNTLLEIAAKQAGLELEEGTFVGPTAVAFVSGEAPDAAKAIKNFAKENDKLIIKGGIMDGVQMSSDDVKKLADLESREVLLAKSAGVLKALLYQTAYVLTAPAVKAVRTIDALRAKEEAAA